MSPEVKVLIIASTFLLILQIVVGRVFVNIYKTNEVSLESSRLLTKLHSKIQLCFVCAIAILGVSVVLLNH